MFFGFRNKFRICDLFGIPVYLDPSFAVILIVMVFSGSSLFGSAVCALLLAVSIVLHELGHSLTARAFGYRTRDITLSLLGGCASIIAMPRKAWQELLTALAGPFVSFALAVSALVVLILVPVLPTPVRNLLVDLCGMNFMLGMFNLLPALPMDGGRVFRSFLCLFVPRVRATYIAMIVGRVVAVAIVVLPLLGIRYLGPFPIGGYLLFRVLIAWMIWQEGRREYLMAVADAGRWRPWTQDDFQARVSPPPYER